MAERSTQVVSQALNKLAAGIHDRSLANRQLSNQLEGWVLRNFAQQGALRLPGGWEPLKLSTLLARLRKGKGSAGKKAAAARSFKQGKSVAETYAATGAGLVKILQDTGALRQAFAGFYDAQEAGVGAVSHSAHADLAIVHEYGNPSRNLPARPMLPTPAQALEMAFLVYQNHVDQARKRANL